MENTINYFIFRGFAFIVYKDPSGIDAAVADEHEIKVNALSF